MAVLIDSNTKIMVQGITGAQGAYHSQLMNLYTKDRVVGGVSPGRGGMNISGIPVYDTISALKKEAQVDASLVMVPHQHVLDAVWEAVDNEIELVVIVAENVPLHDTIRMKSLSRGSRTKIIGPNTMGIISPGKSKIGVMPEKLYKEGKVGILSLLGTLNYEAAWNLSENGIGQSTCLAIGGDKLTGISITEGLEYYRLDERTEQVILIGETPYLDIEGIYHYLSSASYHKPIYAFLAGQSASLYYGKDFFSRLGCGEPYPIDIKEARKKLEACRVRVMDSMTELIDGIKMAHHGK